jgi:cytoskeletal protein CcmA (bactofilin family)
MGWLGSGDNKGMGRVDTLVGPDAVLKGTFTAKNSIRIDGEIHGNVNCEEGVVVGSKGLVRGHIVAKSVVVSGRVKGNITASQRLELERGAIIEGDLSTPLLLVEEGASFEGSSHMEEAGNVVDLAKASRD